MEEFADLRDKFVAIREEIAGFVAKINAAAKGERFAIRIFLINNRQESDKEQKIVGFIENLRIDGCFLLFDLIEERLVGRDGNITEKAIKKKVPIERISKIETFRTKSGKPVIVR